MIPTYSVLSHLRTGSTVVGQAIALYLHNKFKSYNKEYQGEITNIYENLMYFDSNGRDSIVPKNTKPKNRYNKTYDIVNDQVVRIKDYNNLKILKKNTKEFYDEVNKRIECLNHNQKSNSKSVYKIQTDPFCKYFYSHIKHELNSHKFIFCKRNLKDQFISWTTARNTKIYHSLTKKIINVEKIIITRNELDSFKAQMERNIDIFKRLKNQIISILDYDDWVYNPIKIYDLLEWYDYSDFVNENELIENTYTKLKYNDSPKNYILNYDQMIQWMDNDPIFKFKFQ